MNILLELLMTLFKVFSALFWASVHFFIPPPQKSVKGEIILITGGGSGIGRLLAQRLAKLGATIVIWDINKEGNEETARLITENGGKAHAYICDISNNSEISVCSETVKREVGCVSMLINNAGIVSGKKFIDTTEKDIVKTFEVNTFAHVWTAKAFLPDMIKNQHGHIVNIVSSAGYIGVNSLSDYCASKFASVGLTECLDLELHFAGHDYINTTLVCPYYIDTGMFAGCQTRFPWLLPILNPDYAADRITQAILTNQKQLCIPRIIYFLVMLKTLTPISVLKPVYRFLGVHTFMDNYKPKVDRTC
ncbi:unnamed protein product [Owenia fusiformis]|uniref:Uncharacterized protein n=2 Tax=Owenia fusiformis TaxID=6347 RepID=A0A8J1UEE4_OWEFU|nr:unnamed protein product [Owenia fusiformis]